MRRSLKINFNPALISSFAAIFCCLFCSVFSRFESTFEHYDKYSLPTRYNPIFGALLIESGIILNAFLYGDETIPFVKCVKSMFTITDPNSMSPSDLKVVVKKLNVGDILSYLNSSNNSTKNSLVNLQMCNENDSDSAILWAAFYLSRKQSIKSDTFDYIQRRISTAVKNHHQSGTVALTIDYWKSLVYFVSNRQGLPHTQIQSTQSLLGTDANFFNCVESTVLDMINFGIFSNPALKDNIRNQWHPHWSINPEYSINFFAAIQQPDLINSSKEQLKSTYFQIFKDITEGINPGANWAKMSQDLPRISYVNFYIVNSKTTCKGNGGHAQFVKVDKDLFNSLEGSLEPLKKNNFKNCSEILFKHLHGTDIYLTADDGVILFEINSELRNFEGIIRYFFGLDFHKFKVVQSDKESFQNILNIFQQNFDFNILSSLYSKKETTFKFKFRGNNCSGQFHVTNGVHSQTSNFTCIPSQDLLETFDKLLQQAPSLPMKQAVNNFNLRNKFVDDNSWEVFSNKSFNRLFNSSFIKMERIFHYSEKSRSNFKYFFDAIHQHADKGKFLDSFKNAFIAKMQTSELQNSFAYSAEKGDLTLCEYFISMFPASSIDPENHLLDNAAESGYLGIVKLLVENKIKFQKIDPSPTKSTALEMAALKNHTEIVLYLLSKWNEFPEIASDKTRELTLERVAFRGNIEIIKYLISFHEIFPQFKQTNVTNTALTWAAVAGHVKVIQYLLSFRNIFPQLDPEDSLYSAARTVHFEAVEYLIEYLKNSNELKSEAVIRAIKACIHDPVRIYLGGVLNQISS